MKISITNVGPVRRAAITLKPMLLFVGPNNSGKSVIATVMYAALSQTSVATGGFIRRTRQDRVSSATLDAILEDASTYVTEISESTEIPDYDAMPASIREFFSQRIDRSLSQYSLSVSEEIARTTGTSSLQELRRVPRRRPTSATIEIESDAPRWMVRITIGSATNFDVVTNVDLREAWSCLDRSTWRRVLASNARAYRSSAALVTDIAAALVRICFRELPQHTRYLPAARSGLLQSQKALAGALVRRSSLAGVFDLQIPAMNGVITDFLSEMIQMDAASDGDFAEEASELEQNILLGELRLLGEPLTYSEPVYHTSSGDFPLARASSMVSELAPVVLYLRHLLRKGEMLIVEEPEASLHPGSQIAFARSLTHLVNDGLRIVLTTHSEFFVQQINNAIIAAGNTAEYAAEAGFKPRDVVASTDVAAYSFEPSRNGTIALALPIDAVEGIPEKSFSAVSARLYEESIALDRSIDSVRE